MTAWESLPGKSRPSRPDPDRQEKAMFVNHHLATRLARELGADPSQPQVATVHKMQNG
jgi:hypothetical protein